MKILKLNYNIITGSEYIWVDVPDESIINRYDNKKTIYAKEVQTKINIAKKAKSCRKR